MVGTGCVLAFHGDNFVQKSIQDIAKVWGNHVEIISRFNDQWVSNGSLGKGFLPTELKNKLEGLEYGVDYKCYKPIYEGFDPRKITDEMVDHWTVTKYDFRGCFIVQLIWNTTGVWIGARTAKRALKRLYCYEALWYFHRASGIFKKWWKGKPEESFPKDKFQLMYKSDFEKLFINS